MDSDVGHFLDYMSAEKAASDNTLAAYKNDLLQFLRFMSDGPSNGDKPPWTHVSQDSVTDYVLDMRRRRYSEATVARKVAALKSFFAFLHSEGVLKRNPVGEFKSPRVGRSLPKPLTVREVDELLEQPSRRTSPEALRDRAMLELLYATGLRVTELVTLDVSSIQLRANECSVRCIGKGAKERLIPVEAEAAACLQEYMDHARSRLLRRPEETALFLNRRGARLTRQGFWLILRDYAKQAGIAARVTPHTLRHSFATHKLRGGASIRTVQELLGHANPSTTQVYTKLTTEHIREVYDKAHPRAS